MARVTKEPEERKTEIMDAAMELFLNKGFEETAVSDIVKKVGVAQGLFYYYFKSKNEILEAILGKYENYFINKLQQITVNPDSNGVEKVVKFLNEILLFSIQNEKVIRYVHREENAALHQNFALRVIEGMIPLISTIVTQGINEGLFRVDYPEETTGILLYGLGMYIHDFERLFSDKSLFNKRIRAVEDVLERMLGTEKGTFQLLKNRF